MEIKTYLLDNETNVLYNNRGFLLASSFIPCVESIYLEIIYQIKYNRTRRIAEK